VRSSRQGEQLPDACALPTSAAAAAQVSRSRKYTPSQDDVGFVLKYECSLFDPNHPYIDLGRPMLAFTSRVRPAPNLPVRALVPLPLPYALTKGGAGSRFTVLTYNMLADLYAKVSELSEGGWGLGGWWVCGVVVDGWERSEGGRRATLPPGCGVCEASPPQTLPALMCHPRLTPPCACGPHPPPSPTIHTPLCAERRVQPLPRVDDGVALPQAQPGQGAADAPPRHHVPAGKAVGSYARPATCRRVR
jgi:hypothetical protein